ncbi:hypothetical protein KKF81_05760 [Candidatus Micrarchaeota archaeon]|nr:hypothetical protein [Candidatus Micrarchaeota archaeon]
MAQKLSIKDHAQAMLTLTDAERIIYMKTNKIPIPMRGKIKAAISAIEIADKIAGIRKIQHQAPQLEPAQGTSPAIDPELTKPIEQDKLTKLVIQSTEPSVTFAPPDVLATARSDPVGPTASKAPASKKPPKLEVVDTSGEPNGTMPSISESEASGDSFTGSGDHSSGLDSDDHDTDEQTDPDIHLSPLTGKVPELNDPELTTPNSRWSRSERDSRTLRYPPVPRVPGLPSRLRTRLDRSKSSDPTPSRPNPMSPLGSGSVNDILNKPPSRLSSLDGLFDDSNERTIPLKPPFRSSSTDGIEDGERTISDFSLRFSSTDPSTTSHVLESADSTPSFGTAEPASELPLPSAPIPSEGTMELNSDDLSSFDSDLPPMPSSSSRVPGFGTSSASESDEGVQAQNDDIVGLTHEGAFDAVAESTGDLSGIMSDQFDFAESHLRSVYDDGREFTPIDLSNMLAILGDRSDVGGIGRHSGGDAEIHGDFSRIANHTDLVLGYMRPNGLISSFEPARELPCIKDNGDCLFALRIQNGRIVELSMINEDSEIRKVNSVLIGLQVKESNSSESTPNAFEAPADSETGELTPPDWAPTDWPPTHSRDDGVSGDGSLQSPPVSWDDYDEVSDDDGPVSVDLDDHTMFIRSGSLRLPEKITKAIKLGDSSANDTPYSFYCGRFVYDEATGDGVAVFTDDKGNRINIAPGHEFTDEANVKGSRKIALIRITNDGKEVRITQRTTSKLGMFWHDLWPTQALMPLALVPVAVHSSLLVPQLQEAVGNSTGELAASIITPLTTTVILLLSVLSSKLPGFIDSFRNKKGGISS